MRFYAFWILLSFCFLVLAVGSFREWRRLSSPAKRVKLREGFGYPRGVTPFQDRSLEVVASLFQKMFLAETIGFLLAMLGAIIDALSLVVGL